MYLEKENILTLALWGALGFGIGGVMEGAVRIALSVSGDGLYPSGYPILGAVGGASLGLALKGWKRAGLLALVGGVGFNIGYFLSTLSMAAVRVLAEPLGELLGYSAIVGVGYALWGAVGGASLGLALKSCRGVGLLTLAGALGFGCTGLVSGMDYYWLDVSSNLVIMAMSLVIPAIVMGACLGAALGYYIRGKGQD